MVSKDISRDDLLIVLASMGVSLPKETKLPVDELSKRLGSALDASQEMGALFQAVSSIPVDLDQLPIWTSSSDKTLLEACQRGNITELGTGEMQQPKRGHHATKSDTFKEMRQSILGLGYAVDIAIRQISFAAPQNMSGIVLRILDVYKVKDEVPLFFLEFKDLVPSAKESLEKLVTNNFPSGNMSTVPVSHLEYCTLLKLFKRNATKLHEKHREPKTDDKKGFSRTFALPLCPLSMQVLGKLTSNVGCEVCGDRVASKCSQCLTISYCGRECQRADWPNHKATCKSLKGGTWHTINLSDMPALPPGVADMAKQHRFIMNRLDPFTSSAGVHTTRGEGEPLDTHNGKIFLAKFQAPLMGGANPSMMIYDRQRSFQSFWQRDSNLSTFDRAMTVMGGRPKFYKWVRWVGENRMEVCLDRSPPSDPVW